MAHRWPNIAVVVDSKNDKWDPVGNAFTGKPPQWALYCAAYSLNDNAEVLFGADRSLRFALIGEINVEVTTSRRQYKGMIDYFRSQRNISNINGINPRFTALGLSPLYTVLKFIQFSTITTKDPFSLYSRDTFANLPSDGQRFNNVVVRPDNVSIRTKLILTSV